MNKTITAVLLAMALAASSVSAKLPPPSEEAKAKAAETAAKEAEQLAKAQDRVAAKYGQASKAKAAPAPGKK